MTRPFLAVLACMLLDVSLCLADPPTFLLHWGSQGSGEGQFDQPRGATLGLGGELYVADTNNDRIQVFTPDGQFLRSWGTFGVSDGHLNRPKGIAMAADGSLYIVDFWHRIQRFASDGTFLGRVPLPPGVDVMDAPSIAVGPDGSLWVANYHYYEVLKMTTDGRLLARVSASWGRPTSVAVNSQGDALVVTEPYVAKYASDGTPLGYFGPFNLSQPTPNPQAIAFDHHGNVYVAAKPYYGDRPHLYKLTPDGDLVTSWAQAGTAPGDVSWPGGIAVSETGDVFVVDTQNARVARFADIPTAVTTVSWGSIKDSYRGPR